jgi:hypothetical protein
MGDIYAVNDLPHSGDESREADFRTKISLAKDPHSGFLKPGEDGKMSSEHIKPDHDYTVEAQIKIAVHRDIHVAIDNVNQNQKVVLRYDGDQYILEKEA